LLKNVFSGMVSPLKINGYPGEKWTLTSLKQINAFTNRSSVPKEKLLAEDELPSGMMITLPPLTYTNKSKKMCDKTIL
ncbi:hypothetical protein, partial [Candidatus Magnetaquicoccus inordinatus]|uniref:hypothetical protein n=1 Tax=Candidatus Magnetaquicoccus inordinatus TaxID=2496818 RepID=UPI001D0E14F2